MAYTKRPLKWPEIQAVLSIDTEEYTFDFEIVRLRRSTEEYFGPLIQVLDGDRIELVYITAKIYIYSPIYNCFHTYTFNRYIKASKYIHISAIEYNLAILYLRYLTFHCFNEDVHPDNL
jgi:hypothetical protein